MAKIYVCDGCGMTVPMTGELIGGPKGWYRFQLMNYGGSEHQTCSLECTSVIIEREKLGQLKALELAGVTNG